jgi:hypothetical protein
LWSVAVLALEGTTLVLTAVRQYWMDPSRALLEGAGWEHPQTMTAHLRAIQGRISVTLRIRRELLQTPGNSQHQRAITTVISGDLADIDPIHRKRRLLLLPLDRGLLLVHQGQLAAPLQQFLLRGAAVRVWFLAEYDRPQAVNTADRIRGLAAHGNEVGLL